MSQSILQAVQDLNHQVRSFAFAEPVDTVYNPLDYEWRPLSTYISRFARDDGQVLLLGMNPGPWGMAQTGVPFGDVSKVRDWMRVQEAVEAPREQHVKVPVRGFECPRGEVSGQRLWGWAQSRFGEPEAFFKHYFVYNYCPLCFLEPSGRNLTPDKLQAADKRALFEACDEALRALVSVMRPAAVIGIGRFAEQRSRQALSAQSLSIGCVAHPSPANPAANRGWSALMDQALHDWGLPIAS